MLKTFTILLVKNFDSLHERGIKIPPSHPNLIHIYNQLKTILFKKKPYANLHSILLSANSISNFQVYSHKKNMKNISIKQSGQRGEQGTPFRGAIAASPWILASKKSKEELQSIILFISSSILMIPFLKL